MFRILVLSAALAVAGSAHATDADLGTLVPGQSLSFTQSAASFTDTYRLTVGDPVDFLFSFSNLGLGSAANLSVALNGNEIVGAFGRNIEWTWGPFGDPPPFPTGAEFLVTITGSDNTLADASYVFEVFTAGTGGIPPVPEPGTWALMLAGGGAITALAGRRRRGVAGARAAA